MLTVVLLRMDALALPILGTMQLGALTTGHHTIRLGLVFHGVDAPLAALQTIGFALGQAAGGDTLIDTLFLLGLALVNPWGIGLGKGKNGDGQCDGDDEPDLLHFLLLDG